MDEVLQGIPRTVCYINDILITGSNDTEHLEILQKVLERLEEHGVRAKRSKCFCLAKSVTYLGHRVDAEGQHPLSDKLEAVREAPVPRNVSELRSFLGLLNYYRNFLPNLATVLHPLNELLQTKRKWKWSSECNSAFQGSQETAHYDAKLPIRLAADASAYGIGAAISHVMPNGEEKPVAFASRTLTSCEQNYAQIE